MKAKHIQRTIVAFMAISTSLAFSSCAGADNRQDNRGDRQDNRQDNRGDRQDNRQGNRDERQDRR
jgi:hypothetical protein